MIPLRDRLCETLGLNLFGEPGKASDDMIMEVLIQALHERDTLRDRLRTALALPADADDNAIMDELAVKWGQRDALARFRQSIINEMPLADEWDSDESLIDQVREQIGAQAQRRAKDRAVLAKDVLVSAMPRIWPADRNWSPKIDSEDAVAMADALLAALGRESNQASNQAQDARGARSAIADERIWLATSRLRSMLEHVTTAVADAAIFEEGSQIPGPKTMTRWRDVAYEARALLAEVQPGVQAEMVALDMSYWLQNLNGYDSGTLARALEQIEKATGQGGTGALPHSDEAAPRVENMAQRVTEMGRALDQIRAALKPVMRPGFHTLNDVVEIVVALVRDTNRSTETGSSRGEEVSEIQT